jgi:hypothetical protein
VFARGANVAVGAHPAVSPLDRRGTESKLRRLEPSACSDASDDAGFAPARPGVVPVCSPRIGRESAQLNRRTAITARIAAAWPSRCQWET